MAVARETLTGLTFTFPAYTPAIQQSHPPAPGASHKTLIIATSAAAGGFLIALIFVVTYICIQRRKRRRQNRSSIVLHRWLATKERKGLFISRPICQNDGHVMESKQESDPAPSAESRVSPVPRSNRQIPRKPAPALIPSTKMLSGIFSRRDLQEASSASDGLARQSVASSDNVYVSVNPSNSQVPSSAPSSIYPFSAQSIAAPAPTPRTTFTSIRTAISRVSKAPSKRSVHSERQREAEAARASSMLDLRISLYPTTPTSPVQTFAQQMSQSGGSEARVSFAVPDWQYQHFPIDGAARARMVEAGSS